MSLSTRFYTAGLHQVQFALLDSAGYAAGQLGTAFAAGNSSGAYIVPGAHTLALTYNEEKTEVIEETDNEVGEWAFGNKRISKIELDVSDLDPDVISLLSGTIVSTFNSAYDWQATEDNMAGKPFVCLIYSQIVQDADGTDGQTTYFHTIVPRARASYEKGAATYQTKTMNKISFWPQLTSIMPWGTSLTTMAMGVSQGRVSHVHNSSPTNYPIHMHTFWGDNSATTFTTLYKPATADVTAATTFNQFAQAGAATNVTSFSVTTGLVTTASTLGSGVKGVMVYQHNNVLS